MSDPAMTGPWIFRQLVDLFRINGEQVMPMAFPRAEFIHYSIPAWDITGGPAIELGSQIESNKTAISSPSVLVSKLNPRKPRVAAVTSPDERTCCSTEFICYQPRRPSDDLSFWAAYFAANDFSGRLARVAVGSTNSHTRAAPKETLQWLIPEVSPAEQRKIAEVLNTLDTAIHETEAIIAKLKAVKQGLLHDLLTRGIDANGELRPPQSEAPHLYKSSSLGWIPKEWTTRKGAEVCDEIVVGIVIRPTQYYKSEGVPVFRSANVRENNLSLSDLVFMSVKDHLSLRKSAVRQGDVLTVRTGYPGTSCVVDTSVEEANCVDILISRPGPDLNSSYWSRWINSDRGKSQVLAAQGGLAQQHFNVGDLQKLLLSHPPLAEQTEIAKRLEGAEIRLHRETALQAALADLKSGLMDDLLTGRVRVTPLLAK